MRQESQQPSRRTFLKSSGLVALSALTTSCSSTKSKEQEKPYSPYGTWIGIITPEGSFRESRITIKEDKVIYETKGRTDTSTKTRKVDAKIEKIVSTREKNFFLVCPKKTRENPYYIAMITNNLIRYGGKLHAREGTIQTLASPTMLGTWEEIYIGKSTMEIQNNQIIYSPAHKEIELPKKARITRRTKIDGVQILEIETKGKLWFGWVGNIAIERNDDYISTYINDRKSKFKPKVN